MILEPRQIDSSTVEVGVPAVVIRGLGYRDPLTGPWPPLTRARSGISQRLLLGVAESVSYQRIDLSRIQTLIPGETSVSPWGSRDTVQAQTEPVDSLAVEEMPSWWNLENNRGLRWLTKMPPELVGASSLQAWRLVFMPQCGRIQIQIRGLPGMKGLGFS